MLRNKMITMLLWVFILGSGCGEPQLAPQGQSSLPDNDRHPLKLSGISKEEAIAKVKEHVSKTDRSILKFDIVDCEQALFWRVIFDGSDQEYVVDKKTGQIVKEEHIPHGAVNGPVEDKNQRSKVVGINQNEAIAIAKRNLRAWYAREEDSQWFTVSACELAKVWRIIFDVRLVQQPGQSEPMIPSAATWQYSLDKKSGEILHKTLS